MIVRGPLQPTDYTAVIGKCVDVAESSDNDGPHHVLQPASPFAVLRPCLSPTSPVGPIGSDPESDGQVHGNRCEGFGEVIDQHPEEDAKCLRFTRLRIRSLYRNKLR